MLDEQWHKIFADEFETAFLMAVGAYVGTLMAREGQGPVWSKARNEAFLRAAAEAFNAGVTAGRLGLDYEASAALRSGLPEEVNDA